MCRTTGRRTSKLTLDYGIRFVHATPLYDNLMQGGNFLPERFALGRAGGLRVRLRQRRLPVHGNNRQAMNPLTGQFLGPNTNAAVGTLVPGTGNAPTACSRAGQGIAKTSYTFPTLVVGPRFGMAYDVTGKQRLVVRGGIGHLLRSPASGRRAGARGQHRPTRSPCAIRSCRTSAPAG